MGGDDEEAEKTRKQDLRMERWLEGCRANAFATRALVNHETLYRSPRNGHAFGASIINVGGRCLVCKKVLWSFGKSCRLCGGVAHQDCTKLAPPCEGTNEEPVTTSLAALRYAAMRRASETRVGRAILTSVERRRGFEHLGSNDDSKLRAYASRAVVSSAEIAKMKALAQGKEVTTKRSSSSSFGASASSSSSSSSSSRKDKAQWGLWAGATAAGTFAGGVVGGAVAGPAGAFLGAKIGQSGANVGALVLGAAVGYRKRYLLSEEVVKEDAFDRRERAQRAARRATFGRASAPEEPFAACAAAAVAQAHADGLSVEFKPDDFPALAGLLEDDDARLDDRIDAFVRRATKFFDEKDDDSGGVTPLCPSRVHKALAEVYAELDDDSDSSAEVAADRAVAWSRRLCVEIVAYLPSIASSPRALDACERAVDRIVFDDVYDRLFPKFIDPEADSKLTDACDDVDQSFVDDDDHFTKKNRHRFRHARDALLALHTTKPPLDKLHTITDAVRELAASKKKTTTEGRRRRRRGHLEEEENQIENAKKNQRPRHHPVDDDDDDDRNGDDRNGNDDDDDDDVSADVLLPLAVDCVRAARLPHLHAHLAFVEALCHTRDFLGAQGYALTTLRCAVAVLCRNLDEKTSA